MALCFVDSLNHECFGFHGWIVCVFLHVVRGEMRAQTMCFFLSPPTAGSDERRWVGCFARVRKAHFFTGMCVPG